MQAIIDYLKLSGMTQAELAKRAGMQPTQLNHFLMGRREPRIKSLRKLSEATGINIQKIVEGMK